MPEEVNLETYNADPLTEDVSDAATEAAPKTYASASLPGTLPLSRRRTSAPK